MTSNAPKSFFEFVTGTGAGSSSNVGASKTSNSSRGPSGDASTCTSAAQVIATLQKDREYYSSSSLDEYYSLLNIFSILCRTIIMAYNAMEKQQSKYAAGAGISTDSVAAVSGTVSMNDLMHILPPGMKSDLANSFLEGMEYAMNNWKKRLLCIRFSSIDFYSPLAAYNSPDGRDTQNGVRVRKDRDVISYARKRYLHTDPVVTGGGGIVSVHDKSASPNLPLVGVFYAISESLPIVSNVQDALLRMIQEFRVTALTTSKA